MIQCWCETQDCVGIPVAPRNFNKNEWANTRIDQNWHHLQVDHRPLWTTDQDQRYFHPLLKSNLMQSLTQLYITPLTSAEYKPLLRNVFGALPDQFPCSLRDASPRLFSRLTPYSSFSFSDSAIPNTTNCQLIYFWSAAPVPNYPCEMVYASETVFLVVYPLIWEWMGSSGAVFPIWIRPRDLRLDARRYSLINFTPRLWHALPYGCELKQKQKRTSCENELWYCVFRHPANCRFISCSRFSLFILCTPRFWDLSPAAHAENNLL